MSRMSGIYDLERLAGFKHWLNKMGAVVEDNHTQYELIRFRAADETSIIYTGKRGLTFTGAAETAYNAFTAGKPWKAVNRARVALRDRKAALAARDGKRCFAHGERLGFNELTIEHLLSVAHGGNDNNNNLALVCRPCNAELGRLPIAKKIEWIIERRRQYMKQLKKEQHEHET